MDGNNSGLTMTGRLMERKTINTKTGQLTVCVCWAQNGKYAKTFDVVDWDNHLDNFKVNEEISFPVSISQTVSKKSGNSFLNFAVQGPGVSLKRQAI